MVIGLYTLTVLSGCMYHWALLPISSRGEALPIVALPR
jgi:hypothetical protein